MGNTFKSSWMQSSRLHRDSCLFFNASSKFYLFCFLPACARLILLTGKTVFSIMFLCTLFDFEGSSYASAWMTTLDAEMQSLGETCKKHQITCMQQKQSSGSKHRSRTAQRNKIYESCRENLVFS